MSERKVSVDQADMDALRDAVFAVTPGVPDPDDNYLRMAAARLIALKAARDQLQRELDHAIDYGLERARQSLRDLQSLRSENDRLRRELEQLGGAGHE